MDAFTAQIVQLVREMPDEAILALVKNQLGAVFGSLSAGGGGRRAAAPAASGAPAKRGRRAAKRRARASVAAPKPAAAPKAKKVRAPKVRKAAAKRSGVGRSGGGRASADRQSLVGVVERVVKSGSGMSASQVASVAKAPQTRVANALKELKLAKRIFQGGDRRFARYAGDPRTASQASENARKTASGPITKKKGKR